MTKIKIILIMFLFIFNSCKRTNLNKYCIKNINFEIFSIKQIKNKYYKTDSILINDKNKKYLILFTLNKDFVSISPSEDGYPNEGMEGSSDSIIYSSFDLKSINELCVKTNNNDLVNFSNKKLIKDSYSNEICNDKNITFNAFVNYYNTSKDQSYGSQKYFIPFIVDYYGYKKFLKDIKFIKLIKKSKENKKVVFELLIKPAPARILSRGNK